jgi:hypothetical protein
MTSTIDAVLPLTASDYERARILLRSLDRFFVDLGICWIVTPDGDLDAIGRSIRGARYRVIAESVIIPELRVHNWIRTAVSRSHRPVAGWCVQQLVKLAIAEHIQSEFYVTLDADVICTKPVSLADLVRNGRAIADRHPHDIHREWYVWAERVLGLRRSGWTHGVTPALLSREAVLLLQRYLAGRVHPFLRGLGRLWPRASLPNAVLAGWRSYLLRNLPWTEYALYNTFLEATGRYGDYYVEESQSRLYGNSVWQEDQFPSWDPAKSFRGPRDFFFSVVQSNGGPTAQEVWEKVRRYLEAS